MNKVICDICGTSYPDTAEQCPICGYSRELNGDNYLEEAVAPVTEEVIPEPVVEEEEVIAPVVVPEEPELPEQEEIDFNLEDYLADADEDSDEEYDEEDEDDEDEDEEEDDEEEEEEHRSNTGLVVILVILIVALLGVMGFVAVRYVLPNLNLGKETEPVATTAPTETAGTVATTEPTIPCEGLTMVSEGVVVLEEVGANWLINVTPTPENTTDKILYASSDESVATVNEAGKVTAVGQGEAVITITCGEQLIQCKVTCFFIEETTEPTETTAPETFPDETTVPTEPEQTTATEPEETTPATEATEPATEPSEPEATEKPSTGNGEVTLTLKKTDITFSVVPAYYTLEFVEEDIDMSQVKWVSTDGNVAICHNGQLQIVGYGICKITAEYKGVTAECIVRVVAR